MAKSGGFASFNDSLALLVLRIPLGAIFVAHGSQKLLGVFGGQGLTATFKGFEEQLGIPPLFTLLAIIAEFGGGIGILAGLLTRLSAAGIASVMAVAIWKVHLANGFFLNAGCIPGRGHGIEYNVALIGMALSLLFSGGGKWALDRMIWRR